MLQGQSVKDALSSYILPFIGFTFWTTTQLTIYLQKKGKGDDVRLLFEGYYYARVICIWKEAIKLNLCS